MLVATILFGCSNSDKVYFITNVSDDYFTEVQGSSENDVSVKSTEYISASPDHYGKGHFMREDTIYGLMEPAVGALVKREKYNVLSRKRLNHKKYVGLTIYEVENKNNPYPSGFFVAYAFDNKFYTATCLYKKDSKVKLSITSGPCKTAIAYFSGAKFTQQDLLSSK